jgi:hypothetical protein
MAKIPNGILGEFIGTAGNVSGYMRNGKNFIRSKRRRSSKPMSLNRLAQQQKIKICNEFTGSFSGTGFFNKTFPAYGSSSTGYNRATSALMNLAIVGNYPDTAIAYPQALISQGPRPPATDAIASVDSACNISFAWTDNSGNGTAKADDLSILVAYFPELKRAVYSIGEAHRANSHAILNTSHIKNCVAETWMGFLSNNEKDASCSVYTGSLNL